MFNSKYPIICAPMNRVSDLRLALACAEAGIVPSLITYPDLKLFLDNLEVYKNTGNELMAAMSLQHALGQDLHEKILNSCITHIELIEFSPEELTDSNIIKIQTLRTAGIKIFIKILRHDVLCNFLSIIDGVTVKGPEGAGRSIATVDLVTEVKKIRRLYPDLAVIASGGVKNKQDIDVLLDAGACAVSIGTLFAMSIESSISDTAKKVLLEKSAEHITRTKNNEYQRTIVLGEQDIQDDENNTYGLITGVRTGTTGHIFMGNAISEIQSILPVDTIVKKLMGISISE